MIYVLLFLAAAATASADTHPGSVTGHTQRGSTVTVMADTSRLRFVFYTPDILRIDLLPSLTAVPDSSFAVIQSPGVSVPVSVSETGSALSIASSAIRISCTKEPLRLSVSDSSGRILVAEPASGGFSWNGDGRTMRFALGTADHFYGTGERGTSLDKRGQKFESYNTQVGGYSTPLATMNLNVPLLTTSGGYALFIDNTYKGLFDLGATDPEVFSYTAAGGALSVYLIAAPTIPLQLERYTWLTGRQPLPPRWAFGFIQSKNRYETEHEARSIVKTMRDKRIPCDALVLDLKWFDAMGDIAWNESAWPHHDAMVDDFLAQGMKTILITEPYIIQPSRNFAEAERRGYLARDRSGSTFLLDKWWSCGGTCSASLLDLTNPDARRWWWSKHPSAFGTHTAGIWTDLGEPERHPEGMMHHLGAAGKVHNIYNLLWAQTVFDGFSALRPGERVVNLTRSGFAGIQRYGVLPWSGDVARSFGGLEVQMPMLLNMGMSGIAYHNSDIGGYSRMPTTPELYVRWMQYGTFCPIARAHGAGETVRGAATEPWQFGAEAETICRDFLRLRYRLLPYIYTLAWRNYESGMPLARPLFWLDPGDTLLANESSSYMWGDAMLVSPVVNAGQTSKRLYLPRGTWIDLWTDHSVEGGRSVVAAAPLARMPIFVRTGSIIPMAEPMEYSDERQTDTLTLRVYPDRRGAPCSYTLYEDDGKTLGYQEGQYALTTFSAKVDTGTHRWSMSLTAGRSQGTYRGRLMERVYVFDVRGVDRRPDAVSCNGLMMRAHDPLRAAAGGFSYDPVKKTLRVDARCHADSVYRFDVQWTSRAPH